LCCMKDKCEYVQDWLRKASSDMKIALREMEAEDPATDAVCFHFQQAVEKFLKAWLIWHEVKFPPTHNIEILLLSCEKIDPCFEELRRVEALTPYAVEIRYADDFYFPTLDEVRIASEMALETRAFVLNKLSACGKKGPL